MKKTIVLIISILLVSVYSFGTIWANWSDCVYIGNCDEETQGSSAPKSIDNQLKIFIIIGAGQFLKSYSEFQLLLNRVELIELSGVNYEELKCILNEAIFSIENSKDIYHELITLAERTPYNDAVIDKLKNFNYDIFLADKDNLNPLVFQIVKSFLSQGDVTGAYNDMFANMKDILDSLYIVKNDIDKNILPNINHLWELNQKYSNLMLFGNYLAMIVKANLTR